MKKLTSLCLLIMLCAMPVKVVWAQTAAPDQSTDKKATSTEAEEAEDEEDHMKPSLFFTEEELEKLYAANKGFVKLDREKTKTDDKDALELDDNENAAVPQAPVNPGPRVLKLAGILYHGDKDWVIWFNDTRITPKNIPDRVLDLIVRQDKIAIKWLDRGTNRIINLVLRPHQEYHIDTDTITVGTY